MQLWKPSSERIEKARLTKYISYLKDNHALNFSDYQQLHTWSVTKNADFWSSLFEFFKINHSGENKQKENHPDFLSYGWFKNTKLNFAENLLKHKDSKIAALKFIHESGLKKELSYKQLYSEVATFSHKLNDLIAPGDVVAAYMPNTPETVITMLATSTLGGVFTSTSCDFGVNGVVDRFGQSNPKVLVAAIGYEYNGKYIDQRPHLEEIKKKIPSIEKIFYVDFLDKNETWSGGEDFYKKNENYKN